MRRHQARPLTREAGLFCHSGKSIRRSVSLPPMPDFSTLYQLASAQPIGAAALAIIAALLLAALLFRKLKPWQSYLRPQPILTANEREFYHRLTRALPTYPIFPQVAMSALIGLDSRLSQRQQFAIRRRFGWKYCDFVICAPYTLDILLIIELDDRTHDAGSDRKRDAMMRAAGYQTQRYHSKNKPSVAELAEHFAKLLPTLKR